MWEGNILGIERVSHYVGSPFDLPSFNFLVSVNSSLSNLVVLIEHRIT